MLPLTWALALGRAAAWVWYWLIPVRRKIARDNIDRVFGHELSMAQRRKMLRRCLANQAMNGMELLRAPSITAELSEHLVARSGMEHIDAALAAGKGMICALAHLGNIDMIGCSQAIRGLPLHGIFRDVHSKGAQAFVTKVRQRTGMRLIPPR